MRYTNNHKLPESIVRALSGNDYDPRRAASNVISLTDLIGPPKVRQLRRRHWDQMVEDVSESIWRVFGGAVHSVIESFSDKGERLSEERLIIDCEDWKVYSMKPGVSYANQDWYNPDKWYVSLRLDNYEHLDNEHGIIQDFKVTSVWSVVIDGKPKPDWVWQNRIEAMALQTLGFPVTECQNILILRDHSSSKAADANYPDIPVHVYRYTPTDAKKVQEYILDRLQVHEAALEVDEDKIPHCTEEERWAKAPKFAVMKKGRKSAVKLHDSKGAASRHIEELTKKDGPVYSIQERPGSNVRCEGHCPVRQWCSFYKKEYNEPATVEAMKAANVSDPHAGQA